MDQPNRTLLDWLLEKFPDAPRKRAKQWILAGRVSLAGRVVRQPNERLPDPRDTLELQGHRSMAVVLDKEWPIHPRLSLVHLDSSLAVVNKGAGLLSVPAPITDVSALSILADFLAGKLRGLGHRTAERRLPAAFRLLQPLTVHRLDQFTTGVLCFPLNPTARAALSEQFAAHTASREYVGFVDGRPRTPRGTWRHWLRFNDEILRQHVSVNPGGTDALESITHFEALEEFPIATTGRVVSKMRFRLETGRTHQIRAQAAYERLPLIGDRTYHPQYHVSKRVSGKVPVEFERQALHAASLELEHPEQAGKRLVWRVPLPVDLQKLEHTLRGNRRTRSAE